MRKRRGPRRSRWPYVALIAGLVIVLCIIMPTGFWWLIIGALLIALGLYAISSC